MMLTCSGLTSPLRWASARCGRTGGNGCPSMLVRAPRASTARTRRVASAGDSRNTLVKVRTMVPWVNTSGRFRRRRSARKRVVHQWHSIPDPFERLHHRNELRMIEIVQSAVLDHFDQMIKTGDELVQRIVHWGRRIRSRSFIPENHASILIENVFDSKIGAGNSRCCQTSHSSAVNSAVPGAGC